MIPRLTGCLVSLGLLLLPTSVRGQESAPPAPATLAELQENLSAFLAQPRFAGAFWGVKIVSLDDDRTLFEHGAGLRMSPASNCKLYPAALALDTWGAGHRLHTQLGGTGPVDARGVLRGDLIVRGGCDPSWQARTPAREFWTLFEPFIAALRAQGVRRVAGDLVADATLLHGPAHGASWTADDLNEDFGAELSALALEDNYADLRITPAGAAGAACTLELVQPLTGLLLENRTVTTPAGGERRLRIERLLGTPRVLVEGELPAGGKEELTQVTVPHPADWFAAALKEALRRSGIEVRGRARAVSWPDAPSAATVPLADLPSPPLGDLLGGFLKPSQNLETDLVFAALGEARRSAATPARERSDELALAALREFLTAHGLRPDDVRFDEGSGLSRNNLATAAAIVDLLKFMATHRDAAAWRAALPVAGVDGTLKKRLHDSPAAGNLVAKTGGLRWAASLSGYVTTAAGEHLAFSLMLNRYAAPAGRSGAQELDVIADLLARYHGRG